MKIWEEISRIFGKAGERPTAGFYRWLLLLLLLGCGFLWIGSWFSSGKKASTGAVVYEQAPGDNNKGIEETAILMELTAMIESIKGVGNVRIFVTLESGSRLELVRDAENICRKTQEEDSGGGSREILEETSRENYVILRDVQGIERPLVIQESTPRYRGVLVVAEGVENPVVKARVVEALKAVLDLSYHRITVLPSGN